MTYKRTILYHVTGVHIPPDHEDYRLLDDVSSGTSVVLTSNPTKYCYHLEHRLALSNMILDTVFGGEIANESLTSRISSRVEAINRDRQEKYNNGLFVVFQQQGNVTFPYPPTVYESDDFAVAIDVDIDPDPQRESESPLAAVLGTLTLAADSIDSIKKVNDGIVYFNSDRPLYVYKFQGSAQLSISKPLSEQLVETARLFYFDSMKSRDLDRTMRLLMASMKSKKDALRGFLFAWMALEMFVNKVFRVYEDILYDRLEEGDYSKSLFDRIREVMKDKYSLANRFEIIAAILSTDDAEADRQQFIAAKKHRDNILHGHDIAEDSLPISETQSLTRKYVRLHLSFQ